MKEIEQHDKIEIREVKEVEKQQVFIGHSRLKRGHKCWEVNLKTEEITEAKFEITAVDYIEAQVGVIENRRKLIMKPECLYFNGLNKRSVIKQLNNLQKLQNENNR